MTTSPPAPEPDLKDWTWVMRRPCPDCGFDPGAVERGDVPALTRRYAATVAGAVRRPDATSRPQPTIWSPLEYGCHARDVCVLFARRLARMLTEDDPQFENWNQDVTALDQQYWTQRAGDVATALEADADAIAGAFAAVADAHWQRPGRRDDGTAFTVDTFARYFLHDLAHHAWDVTARTA